MFDINNAINAAIETAVQERFTEMAQQYANNVGAMAEIITKLDTRIADLEEANTVLVERLNNVHEPVDRHEVVTIAHDTFIAEWERKVGSNDLLGRDEVAEVVRELWSDEFEDEVDDKVDRAVDNIDLSDAVRNAVRDLSFSVSVD